MAMYRLIRFFLIITLFVLCMSSCLDKEERVQSVIQNYREYDSVSLYLFENPKKISFRLDFIGPCEYSFLDSGEKKEKYDRLCEIHGDTNFNKMVSWVGLPRPLAMTVTPDVASIDITSDRRFDSNHGPGESLNDLVVCEHYPYYEFILNGYRWKGKELKDYEDVEALICYKVERLSEMKEIDFCLWSIGNTFTFTKNPDEAGDYNLTVTVEDVNHRVLKSSCLIAIK